MNVLQLGLYIAAVLWIISAITAVAARMAGVI
jgi:hypothetical protein